MLKLKNFLLVFATISLATYLVSSQEDQETEEERQKACEHWNSVRANYTICCEYPILVIWTWQYRLCEAQCEKDGEKGKNCCILPCCLNTLGVMNTMVNEDGKKQIEVDWKGLVYSFLLSVGNDTQWTPIITETVQRCYSQFSETNEFLCGDRIPSHLFLIIDCSYLEHYLKCAKWNPHDLKECEYTYKYVQKCSAEKGLEQN